MWSYEHRWWATLWLLERGDYTGKHNKSLQTHFHKLLIEVKGDSWYSKYFEGMCRFLFTWTFVYKKVVSKIDTSFANSGPKTTASHWFPALFGIVSAKYKRLFAQMCNSRQNLNAPLQTRVKLRGENCWWTSPKVAKSAADSWLGYVICILGCVRYFVHWLLWKRQNSQ